MERPHHSQGRLTAAHRVGLEVTARRHACHLSLLSSLSPLLLVGVCVEMPEVTEPPGDTFVSGRRLCRQYTRAGCPRFSRSMPTSSAARCAARLFTSASSHILMIFP